jgi:hypothetical protein
MNIRSTVTALSTALALAIVLTSASTPAFAAKSNNGDTKPWRPSSRRTRSRSSSRPARSSMLSTRPKFEVARPGLIVDAINTNPQPTFKPDVRVNYLDFG